MKLTSILVAGAGVVLVAASTAPPGGTRYFVQSNPPNASVIRALGKSHLSLVSDLFWVRTIGVSINLKVPADGLALIGWCQFVTDLDRTFLYPYLMGGLIGPVLVGDTYSNVNEANALLQKGVEALPAEHRLAMYLSYNQLHLQKDPAAAAATLRKGSKSPTAPLFMAQLATRLMAQTDDFSAARDFAMELETRSPDPEVREFFNQRRKELDRDAGIAALQKAVDAFRAAHEGRLPATLEALVTEGLIAAMPEDPLGGTFLLSADGTVSSTSGERLKARFQGNDR